MNYNSRRSPVLCRHGMVACSQPLAAEAGLRLLRAGANAAEAAVGTAAAMAVLEPCSTGLGGDAFALFYDAKTRTVSGLNGSGHSPGALTFEDFVQVVGSGSRASSLPSRHAHTVTVPGAAAAWMDTVTRWGGGMALSDLLAPAVDLARNGFPVAPVTAAAWQSEVPALAEAARGHPSAFLLDGGRAPAVGEVFRNPDLATVLEELGRGGKAAFYEGRVARAIVAAVESRGGRLSLDDLKAHTSTAADPISTVYRGVRVWELPPNTQGLVALLALGTLEQLRLDSPGWFDPVPPPAAAEGEGKKAMEETPVAALLARHPTRYFHLLVESLRWAFSDARRVVADPGSGPGKDAPVAALLSATHARARFAAIDPLRATADTVLGRPTAYSDTISLQVVDAAGNACSFINSNYLKFGTGIVPDGCGFSLQNRGAGFCVERGHPNAAGPHKRPYHTLVPGMATYDDDGSLFASFSNMGGFMQPQGHVQLLVGLLDRGLDPQATVDAPRFCVSADGDHVEIEDGAPKGVLEGLRSLGHAVSGDVLCGWQRQLFGKAQVILRDRTSGVLWGGSDGRGDGCAMGY